MKSPNFVDNANCKMKEQCSFYAKDSYSKEDVFYYIDYCLKIGNGCKIKKELERKLNE